MSEIAILGAIISAVFPIFFFFSTGAKRASFNWFLLAFTLFSIIIDIINYYLASNKIHNHFVINFYDYFAIILELSFILNALPFKRKFKVFSLLLIVIYSLIHFQINMEYGWAHWPLNFSFLISLTVCIYCGVAILKVLLSESNFSSQSKYVLLPIFGLLIFEAACLIPLCSYGFQSNEEDRWLISFFYIYVVLFGNVIRNVLFTIYFIMARRNFNEHQNFF